MRQARQYLARRLGIAPGTLENLRRGRIKDPRKSLYDKLQAAVIRELEAEMRAHEHELQLLKQKGADPRGGEVQEVLANLQAIHEAMK